MRRFGLDFLFHGFMGWMGYFFASFLGTTWLMLGWPVADTAIAWVSVLRG